jgi:hypothetical protein
VVLPWPQGPWTEDFVLGAASTDDELPLGALRQGRTERKLIVAGRNGPRRGHGHGVEMWISPAILVENGEPVGHVGFYMNFNIDNGSLSCRN